MVAKGAYSISFSDMLVMLTGFIGSAFIAFITIKSFLQFVEKIGMTPFVIYRVALGVLLLLIGFRLYVHQQIFKVWLRSSQAISESM